MLKSFFEQFADLIYKQKCVVCGCSKTNEILCKNCLKTVQNLSPFAQKKIEGVNIFCAFKYDGNIKILIRNFKFNRRKNAAHPFLKRFRCLSARKTAHSLSIQKFLIFRIPGKLSPGFILKPAEITFLNPKNGLTGSLQKPAFGEQGLCRFHTALLCAIEGC